MYLYASTLCRTKKKELALNKVLRTRVHCRDDGINSLDSSIQSREVIDALHFNKSLQLIVDISGELIWVATQPSNLVASLERCAGAR